MRGHRPFVVWIVAAVVLASGARPVASEEHSTPVTYRPPVDAALTDTFRPPATPYGPGNRGVDYGTTTGQPVHAAADGEVVFAGRIGSTAHVTVLHDDGIRTTYSFLATTAVRRGQRITQSQPIGTTGDIGLHFGARAGEAYVDPLVLLGQASDPRRRSAYLVDDPDPTRPLTEVQERNLILETLRSVARTATEGADWLKDQAADNVRRRIELLRVLADDAIDLGLPMPVHLAIAVARWRTEQEHGLCTAAETPPPTTGRHAGQRRIAVLVGGLGSATGKAAVLDVDTQALGYDETTDVHQFSYHPDGAPYGPEHTQGDIGEQGARLARQIQDLQRRHPGVPVDVIAHSQGGLVARAAITTNRAAPTTVVTLGTPHQGTDVATLGMGVDATIIGGLFLDVTSWATEPVTSLDLDSTSIRQMAETSDFIRDLPERGWDPATTHVVSVAARADPAVPNHQSRLDAADAYSTVVTPHGTSTFQDHSTLPGSPEATTEIRRALVRQPPTCRTLQEATTDAFVGRHTSDTIDSIGAVLAVGGVWADARTGRLVGISNR